MFPKNTGDLVSAADWNTVAEAAVDGARGEIGAGTSTSIVSSTGTEETLVTAIVDIAAARVTVVTGSALVRAFGGTVSGDIRLKQDGATIASWSATGVLANNERLPIHVKRRLLLAAASYTFTLTAQQTSGATFRVQGDEMATLLDVVDVGPA